jgi:hypothetical protein
MRRLAEATAAVLRARLKLTRPVALRWFAEPCGLREPGRVSFWSTGPIRACVQRDYPDTIWLRADPRSSDRVIEDVAHEMRHLYQHEQRCDIFRADHEQVAWQEADAKLFAADYVGGFGD